MMMIIVNHFEGKGVLIVNHDPSLRLNVGIDWWIGRGRRGDGSFDCRSRHHRCQFQFLQGRSSFAGGVVERVANEAHVVMFCVSRVD